MTTSEAAKQAGISSSTLRRWLREGLVKEPERTPTGWRTFGLGDVRALRKTLEGLHGKQKN